MIYLLDKNQEVIHIVPTAEILELWQEMGINEVDTLHGSLILSSKLKGFMDETYYVGIADLEDKHSFNIYKILKKELTNDEINFRGIQLGFDELAGKGYVRDMRPSNEVFSSVLGRILQGSGWDLGFVDDRLPRVSGNFYYVSRLEAIGSLINITGAELKFKVAISNNKITQKYVEAYVQIGNDSGKRFTYGSNALSIVAEEDTAELFTAVVGRGRGEEVSSADDNPGGQAGYGRKITFENVEWSKSNGDPVDKPLGQEYVEIVEATEMFGYPDGSPRTTIIDYSDIDDEELLLRASYEDALELSRPKAQFKTSAEHVGKMGLGDSVSVIRYDLNIKYKARAFSVKYNRLNIGASEINIGDVLIESYEKRQANFKKQVNRELRQIDRDLETTYIVAANGTRVTFSPDTPTKMRVDDVWYEELPNGKSNIRVWNGNEWIIEVSDAFGSEIKGRIEQISDEVEAVNTKAQGTIDNINEVVTDNGFTTLADLFASKIGTEDANTLFYQEAEALGLVYMEDGVQKAIIAIQDGVPYIKGENVILDGDTIVDGTFEVTGEMMSESAVIDQLKATGIDASEINVINLTVDSLTGGSIDLAKGFSIVNNGVPVLEIDGSTGEVVANLSKLQINFEDVATRKDLEDIELLPGEQGESGKSAYEIAVDEGFVGTEQEWLDSLKGEDGQDGPQGPAGADGTDGADGVDGVSITGIKEQYYHSNSPTELVGGSWSDSRPDWADGKYIWLKTITTFSEGNPQETSPISVSGSSGEDGRPNYTWVKYALVKSPTSSQMQDNPEDMIYRGVAYNQSEESPSTNPVDYTWEPMYDVNKLHEMEDEINDFRLLISIQDTLNDNFAPSYYLDNFSDYEVTERKFTTTVGVDGASSYGLLTTYVMGDVVGQTFSSGGVEYHRASTLGADSWESWVESETVEGATEKSTNAFGEATEYAINLVDDLQTRSKNYVDGLVEPLSSNLELVSDDLIDLDARVEANSSEWRQVFSVSGGVNEIRNSVGYAELEFWNGTGNVSTVQNAELEAYGSGSAFILSGNTTLSQDVVAPSGDKMFSAIIQKDKSSVGYIEIEHEGGSEFIPLSSGQEMFYDLVTLPFNLVGSNYTITLKTEIGSEILFTNIMVNQGTERQGWSFAHDEMYGSTFRMNRNGFRVYQLDGTQYTAMTPQEFAGYAIVGGVWQRTFALNGDTTQMKKAYVEEELRIGGISMLRVNTSTIKGLAFVRSGD